MWLYVTNLPSLVVAIAIAVVQVKCFNLSCDFAWPLTQRIVWLNGLKFLVVSHHLAKFNGHRSHGSSDAAAEIFYGTLQDDVIKGSGDSVEGTSSLYIPTLPKLIATDIVVM